MPPYDGIELYAKKVSIPAPIDAVFSRGSERVGRWLERNAWQREWGYNSNFKDRAVVEDYELAYRYEHPLYTGDVHAMLGGWHVSWPEGDFLQLIDEELLITTFHDCE